MNPRRRRFLNGFHFQINYDTLRYMAVCGAALVAAMIAAWATGGDEKWVVLAGAGCYIVGRLVVWVLYRE